MGWQHMLFTTTYLALFQLTITALPISTSVAPSRSPTGTIHVAGIPHATTFNGIAWETSLPSSLSDVVHTWTTGNERFTFAEVLPTPTRSPHNSTSTAGSALASASAALNGNRGDNIICVTARWYHISTFILLNVVLHGATLKSLPGETGFAVMLAAVAALCIPFSGARRGINAIATGAIFQRGSLQKAAAAGALCVVVRDSGLASRERRFCLRHVACRRSSYRAECCADQGPY